MGAVLGGAGGNPADELSGGTSLALQGTITMRAGGRNCLPTIYIDGIRQWPGDQELLWYMAPADIAVMEVYPRGMLVPAEFLILNSTCGAIVVWTKNKVAR